MAKKLTAEEREAQFQVVESREFTAWYNNEANHLAQNVDSNHVGRKPTKYDYYYGRVEELDPSVYDAERTEAVELFELQKRRGKPLTINPKNNLKRALLAGVDQIGGQDPQLAQFWADAEEVAKALGYCGEFAQVARIMGGPKVRCD